MKKLSYLFVLFAFFTFVGLSSCNNQPAEENESEPTEEIMEENDDNMEEDDGILEDDTITAEDVVEEADEEM